MGGSHDQERDAKSNSAAGVRPSLWIGDSLGLTEKGDEWKPFSLRSVRVGIGAFILICGVESRSTVC